MNPMNRLVAEYRVFASCPAEMRVLLIADTIYALVLPVIEIFVAAYVMRTSHYASNVLFYQLAIYAATPLAFLINGYMLRAVSVNRMYAAGMFLSGGALLVLMASDVRTWHGIVFSGGLMGLATGLFWANRGCLALSTTNDLNRNYFYGVETGVITVTSVIVPFAVGTLIEYMGKHDALGSGLNHAYHSVAVSSLLLTIVASAVVLRGRFGNPPTERFIYRTFDPLWYRLLALAALRGLGQGYIITAPALLILKLAGQEETLGKVEALGSCVAAMCFYGLGRMSKPKHRVRILAAGILFFLFGSTFNALLFNRLGVLVFMGCLLLAKPLIDLAYNPIELRTIDVVSQMERRSSYTYILNHEFGVFAGRFAGCALFIAIAIYFSETDALKYALPIVAVLQLPAIVIARRLPV
jgi:MFS transporter, YQGE family, putative transporter